jgi:hypothetical protein
MKTAAAHTRITSLTLAAYSVAGLLLATIQPARAQTEAVASARANTTVPENAPQASAAASDTPTQSNAPGPDASAPALPAINWLNRWQEDWSVLADPSLRTDPFDPIKYVPLGSDPQTYLSLGLTIRERFESTGLLLTPVVQPDNYLLDRTQFHADLHLGSNVQIFTEAIDARAPWKAVVGPVDQDRMDLEEAFVAVTIPVEEGNLKVTVGRQEPDFDLQRFGALQDGPNVREPFDAIGVSYTRAEWDGAAFYAQPVNVLDQRSALFSTSSKIFTFSGARVDRRNLGAGKLSLLVAQLRNDNAFYLAASGHERRNVIDLHYVGRADGWDWDVEGMGQTGHVEEKTIRAWGGGALFGYTWESRPWSPRLGFQFDAASGTDNPNGNSLGTFNPLFPNGFYEMLSGYPGYANFVHLRLPAMVHPTKKLSALFDVGSLWRMTTADAVYFLPAVPVLGTAGHGGAYSGTYGQIRLDWRISRHLAGALDNEYFAHSQSLQQAGARNGHYIGVELNFGI